MSNFVYSADTINKMIEDSGCKKATMRGVYDSLGRLKPLIENFYDEYIFFLSYWKNDCAFHGWEWSKDDGTMSSMAKITDGITKNFEEIYALILAGLGEKCKKEEDFL